jgi:ABC-type sugar transport system permease subunit
MAKQAAQTPSPTTIRVARPSRQLVGPGERRRLARRYRMSRELRAWFFLGPMFLFFVVFLVLPTFGVGWWSLQSGGLISGTSFAGLRNFISLPNEINARAAMWNTLYFAAVSVPVTLVLALGVAMALARVGRGASAYRFFIYLPVLVPGVVAGLIWLFLVHVDFGLFNIILRSIGLRPQNWLGYSTALPVVIVVDVWRSVGYWAIFFLAAVVGLPHEIYQAAELDGARGWRRFFYITLPLLRRMILFAVVVGTIWGLQVFDTPLILTQGGPGTATLTVIYQVWRFALSGGQERAGVAAAMSLVLLLIILVLTVVQLRLLRGRDSLGGGVR